MRRLSLSPIDPARLTAALLDPALGGVVTFEGRVRGSEPGFRVDSLSYECYEPMAEALIAAILAEALARWPGGRAEAAHRIGPLLPGDVALWVGAAWPHRKEAFAACQWIIDCVKTRVPIWKEEWRSDGKRAWLDGETIR